MQARMKLKEWQLPQQIAEPHKLLIAWSLLIAKASLIVNQSHRKSLWRALLLQTVQQSGILQRAPAC
jgi:hypothetical protein